MDLGGFSFEFPVWIIRLSNGDDTGVQCCQFGDELCLPIFTDQDLARRFLTEHPSPHQAVVSGFDSAACLVAELGEFVESVPYVAFDPAGNRVFIWPLPKLIRFPPRHPSIQHKPTTPISGAATLFRPENLLRDIWLGHLKIR